LPILKLLRKILVANCAQHVDSTSEATTIGDIAPRRGRHPLTLLSSNPGRVAILLQHPFLAARCVVH
jgi:hypothetical protein